jgi:hypothetical protein
MFINKHTDLNVQGGIYVALCFSILLYDCNLTGKPARSPSSFPSSLRSKQVPHYHRSIHFATVFELPVSSSTLPLSPFTLITIANFSDGQATSLVYHLPEPQEKLLLVGSIILDFPGAHK